MRNMPSRAPRIAPSAPSRRFGRGFTLVELLVVVGIIAVLIAVLLPSLKKARQQALRVVCLSNARQLGQAMMVYAADHEQTLAYANWEPTGTSTAAPAFPNAPVGWLYRSPPGLAGNPDPAVVKTGNFWPYLKTLDVYRCPGHPREDAGGFGQARSDRLTSYLVNGSINNFGVTGAQARYHRLTRFRADDVLIWEADERGAFGWNDGSSFPGESFNLNDPYPSGLTARHGDAAAVTCMDGRAELMTHDEFRTLAMDPFRNRLWCAPGTPNGR